MPWQFPQCTAKSCWPAARSAALSRATVAAASSGDWPSSRTARICDRVMPLERHTLYEDPAPRRRPARRRVRRLRPDRAHHDRRRTERDGLPPQDALPRRAQPARPLGLPRLPGGGRAREAHRGAGPAAAAHAHRDPGRRGAEGLRRVEPPRPRQRPAGPPRGRRAQGREASRSACSPTAAPSWACWAVCSTPVPRRGRCAWASSSSTPTATSTPRRPPSAACWAGCRCPSPPASASRGCA